MIDWNQKGLNRSRGGTVLKWQQHMEKECRGET